MKGRFHRGPLAVLAVMLLAVASLAACSALPTTPAATANPAERPKPVELTVLHTNDTNGYTDPCG